MEADAARERVEVVGRRGALAIAEHVECEPRRRPVDPRDERALVGHVRNLVLGLKQSHERLLCDVLRGLTVAEHAPGLRANGREEAAVDGGKVKGCGHGGWLRRVPGEDVEARQIPATDQSDFRTTCAGGDAAP